MSDNLVKIVNIIESNVISTEPDPTTPDNNAPNVPNDSSILNDYVAEPEIMVEHVVAATPARRSKSIRATQNEEVFLRGTTFSERAMRYVVVVIYLCGLCSLGFFLSIYHIFFWDSRMPPVYKPAPTKKSFYVKH